MPFVIQSGSKQYTVTPGQKFVVDRLKNDLGEVVELPLVYSYGTTKGATSVQAKVVLHQKGKKIRVVKYKNKNNYHKQSGYRHYETILEILGDSVAAIPPVKVKAEKAEKVEKDSVEIVKPIKVEKTVVKAATKETVKKSPDNSAGINTYSELAAASEETLKEILSGAGPRYSIHNPASWPNQASLARDEKWDELAALQKELNGGKVE